MFKSSAYRFTFASLAKAIVGMAFSLTAIKVIGPEKLGLWQAALVIKPFISFMQLGIIQGLGRELPLNMGKGNHSLVNKFAATTQTLTAIYTSICLIVTIIIAFNIESNTLLILTVGIYISTTFVDGYLSSTYRSSQNFIVISNIYIIVALLQLLFIPVIFYFNFEGYLIIILILSMVESILLIIFRPIKVDFYFSWIHYKKLLSVGFRIYILAYLRNIPDTFGKLFILYFGSTTLLGLTAPSNAILTGFSLFPASIIKYIYPRMTYEFGLTSDKLILWKHAKKILLIFSGLSILGILLSIFFPWLINVFFTKYIEAIVITSIAAFIGSARMFSVLYNVLITLNDVKYQIYSSIIRNVVYIILPLLFIFFMKQNLLIAIFYGMLMAEFISNSILVYLVYLSTHCHKE